MSAMPAGYRFHPTDYEIISYYLTLKMNGQDSLVDGVIGEIDHCKFEPWELSDLARMKSDDQVWYFFCRTDYKNPNRKKASMSRTTRTGFWKLTGKVRYIKAKGKEDVIGSKRTLVFYSKDRNSSTKASRTNWVILEYQAQTGHPNQGNFVVVKVKNKALELSEERGIDSTESFDKNARLRIHYKQRKKKGSSVFPRSSNGSCIFRFVVQVTRGIWKCLFPRC